MLAKNLTELVDLYFKLPNLASWPPSFVVIPPNTHEFDTVYHRRYFLLQVANLQRLTFVCWLVATRLLLTTGPTAPGQQL